MAKKESAKNVSVKLVANAPSRATLAKLGKPLTDVIIKGNVVTDASGSVLMIENVLTQPRSSLQIIANAAAKKKLADLATDKGGPVTLSGTVVDRGDCNLLVLSGVVATKGIAICADNGAKAALAEIADEDGAEVTINGKIVKKGGASVLVLAGVESKKKKK